MVMGILFPQRKPRIITESVMNFIIRSTLYESYNNCMISTYLNTADYLYRIGSDLNQILRKPLMNKCFLP